MKKILLIEDNEAILKGLKYSLEQEMFEVEIAKDFETAKEKLCSNEYNLIILDVMLPDGNGFELCKCIKQKIETPVIFLTAKDEEQDVVKGFELGADDYVIKPFRIRELISRINNILNILEPIALPSARPLSPFPVATIEVTSSGREVPTAMIVRPIKLLHFTLLSRS